MTSEQKEKLNKFKSLLRIMYNAASIDELADNDSDITIVRAITTDKESFFFRFDTNTGENEQLNIKCIERLPLSKNYVVIEESLDMNKCYIEILSSNTLETIDKTELSNDKTLSNLYNSGYLKSCPAYKISTKNGYVSLSMNIVDAKNSDRNIHGIPIGMEYSFSKLRESTFISNRLSQIRVYDNIEDMNLVNIINLETFGGKLEYYPILNNGKYSLSGQQVIFLHMIESDRIYAYSFEDGQIHVVDDTRYKISIEDFINKLKQCLDTSDNERLNNYSNTLENFGGKIDKQREYEKSQFNIDCDCFINDKDNIFSLNIIKFNKGKYLTPRTLLQCVKEYQHDFNGDVHRYSYENTVKNYNNTSMKDIDRNVAMRMTPYREKSLEILSSILREQSDKNLGKLIVTDKIVSKQELILLEGLKN